MKNLLVIGGTGFIGYHIINEAKKRGFSISSISLNRPKKIRFHKGVRYIKADISNFTILKKKLNNKFDYVINAGGYGIHPDFGKKGEKLINSHFFGLINILQILKLRKIKKFVQLGSSAEYGKTNSPIKENNICTPKTPYSIAKFLCTNILLNLYKEEKFPVTILRLFQVYGPKQDDNRIIPYVIKRCKKNKKFSTTKGKQTCDFCHINDVVSAIFRTFNKKKTNGEIFNIGSGYPIKVEEVIRIIKKYVGKGNPVLGGLKYKKEINMKNFPNINKAKIKLGWVSQIKLKSGLKDTIDSY